jgi:multidrug efflux pump
VPQLDANIDRTRPSQQGMPLTDVFDTLQIYLGSPLRQRLQPVRPHLQVRVQADAPFRAHRGHRPLLTRNSRGEMVPLVSR